MDAITLLQTRNSVAALSDPGPSAEQIQVLLSAAVRAPDHARLRPWRFLTISGDDRQALGQLFVDATQQRLQRAGDPLLDDTGCARLAAKPLRAPLIVVVIARVTEHPKVPPVEQLLSAGCAAHGILLAAHAMGFGAIWRTGANAFDPTVASGLGLGPGEQIVGYLYLGTPVGYKPLPEVDVDAYSRAWHAPAKAGD